MTETDGWIDLLRRECHRPGQSQNRVARRLGVSPAMVNQILSGKYRGNYDTLANRVRGELMGHSVECPVLGPISRRVCQDWQEKPLETTNQLRVMVYRACRAGCPHSKLTTEEDS